MKTCPKCGTQHPNRTLECPHCNTPLEQQSAKKLIWIIPLVVVYLAVMTFAVLALTDTICVNHNWVSASCTEARVCKTCGETDGISLGHTWTDATCTAPKTCSVCGETEGEELPHTIGSWHILKSPTLIAVGTEQRFCTVCNTVLESRTLQKKTPAALDDTFNFTGEEFIEWLSSYISVDFSGELAAEEYSNITYPTTNRNGEEGAVSLNCEGNNLAGDVHGIIVYFEKVASSIALATQLAAQIDPTFEVEAAKLKLLSGKTYRNGNITMMLYTLEGMRTVIFAPTNFIGIGNLLN